MSGEILTMTTLPEGTQHSRKKIIESSRLYKTKFSDLKPTFRDSHQLPHFCLFQAISLFSSWLPSIPSAPSTRYCIQASRGTWRISFRSTTTWQGRRRQLLSTTQTSHFAEVPTYTGELSCSITCPWSSATTCSRTCSRPRWSPGSRITFQQNQPNL